MNKTAPTLPSPESGHAETRILLGTPRPVRRELAEPGQLFQTGTRAGYGPFRGSSARLERRQSKAEAAGSSPAPGSAQPDEMGQLLKESR